MPPHDASAGYESVAAIFQAAREQTRIGASTIAAWAQTLPPGTEVLELGCGAGVPVAQELARAGCVVWGIDASPTLLARFAERLPQFQCACHDLATSPFFGRTFGAVVAVGVLFLLPPDTQRDVIARVARVLEPGGLFLFTSPAAPVEWTDALTGHGSHSLGAVEYTATLTAAGLTLVREFTDEGGNHYFLARRDDPAGAPR